jgi:hypothetical protein
MGNVVEDGNKESKTRSPRARQQKQADRSLARP